LLPRGHPISDEELASVIADSYAIADLAIDEFLTNKNQNNEPLKPTTK
jgi:hypothetical protein